MCFKDILSDFKFELYLFKGKIAIIHITYIGQIKWPKAITETYYATF
jgi:hypothetical protein